MALNIPISAVLFDLDDTLNDRQRSWDAFVPLFQKEYVDQLGVCDAVQISRVINADRGGYREKNEFFMEIGQALPWINRPSAEAMERFWRSCFADCMVERAGALALMTDLRKNGIRIGIVTNGRTDMQTAKIARLGFDALAGAIIVSEAVGTKKPDRRIFHIALEALRCDPKSALFVGDHPVLDVGGAHSAGISAAWLNLGREWPDDVDRPEYNISTVAELRPILGLESTSIRD